ncbi:protoporphyrinogen oxidase [Hoyosella sp. YIM 151337]|uniref:protoporphyrinogen oxidase n=1 Tax=Hoyosella sp. YIM 151337 TaxID=2992742 RepID=UPI002235D96A|nr:protoporphyrinogen oxidase [Hoyosella sp. YIM 151337]MCW4353283.1 protoporphyrinogen oxidase [Hoyosella sp. YIM 151337]
MSHRTGQPVRAAVLGGGISGLTAAYRLRRALGNDAQITLYEGSARVGGKLHTQIVSDFEVDVGAEAFVRRRPEMLALASELGLSGELVAPGGYRPVIWSQGVAHPLPSGAFMGIPASSSSIADLGGLVSRATLEYAAAEADRPIEWSAGTDCTLAELVGERFGQEVARRSVDPLIAGVYAGDSRSVSVRSAIPELARALDMGAPSVTAAVQEVLTAGSGAASGPVFATFRNGYKTLLSALLEAARPDIRNGAPASIVRGAQANWEVVAHGSSTAADIVILAVPAHALSHAVATVAPEAASASREIRHASSAVVTFAFPGDAELPEWSGVLVAGDEDLHAKAVTFTSRKWPHHAGRGLLRVSLGRFGDPEPVTDSLDDVLIGVALRDLRHVSHIVAEPRAARVQRWPDGLPQYECGHSARVNAIEGDIARLRGVGVAGCYLHGVGVPACVASAEAAVTKALGDMAG